MVKYSVNIFESMHEWDGGKNEVKVTNQLYKELIIQNIIGGKSAILRNIN